MARNWGGALHGQGLLWDALLIHGEDDHHRPLNAGELGQGGVGRSGGLEANLHLVEAHLHRAELGLGVPFGLPRAFQVGMGQGRDEAAEQTKGLEHG